MCGWEKRNRKLGKERGGTGWSGSDNSIESREDRKVLVFSDLPREKGMRERVCGPDSSLDRGATWGSLNSAAWKGGMHSWCLSARMGCGQPW